MLLRTEPLHAEWLAANPAQRSQMRTRRITGFVESRLQVSQTEARRIATSRTRRERVANDWERSFDAARKQFDYHIARIDLRIKGR